MPLFECGGANILQDIAVSAKPSEQVTLIADELGYDGIRRIAVAQFTNNDTRTITTNGPYSTLDGTGKSYLNFDVNVPRSSNDPSNYRDVFTGSIRSNGNKVLSNSDGYNASTLISAGYNYIVIYAQNSVWTHPSTGQVWHGTTYTATAQAIIPLGATTYGTVGMYADIPNFSQCYASMPYYITPSQIVLCPTGSNLVHLCDDGTITKVRIIR